MCLFTSVLWYLLGRFNNLIDKDLLFTYYQIILHITSWNILPNQPPGTCTSLPKVENVSSFSLHPLRSWSCHTGFTNLWGEMSYLGVISFLYLFFMSKGNHLFACSQLFGFFYVCVSCQILSPAFYFPDGLLVPYMSPSSMACAHFQDIWGCDQIT